MHLIAYMLVIAAAGSSATAATTSTRERGGTGTGYPVPALDGARRLTDTDESGDARKMAVRGPLTMTLTTTVPTPLRTTTTTTTESSFLDYFIQRDEDDEDDDDDDDDDGDDDAGDDDEDGEDDDDDNDYNSDYADKLKPPKLRGVRRRHKPHHIVFPLLMAYKLKFFTMLPLLVGSLVLLVGTTGVAGFFFALFSAALGLQVKAQH